MQKTDSILSAKSLRYFLQLIETMNYTQAAQILGITQPALTQQLKKLERTIGTPLFGQIGKKLYLTEAGKQMQSAAVELLQTINSVVENIQEFTKKDQGTISIGVLETLDMRIFRDFVLQFAKKYPQIKLNIIGYSRRRLWQKLDKNLIDLAIMYLPDNTRREDVALQNQYDHFDFYKDRIVVLSHKAKLLSGNSYPVSKFVNSKWVAFPDNFYLSQLMYSYFGSENKAKIALTFSKASDLVAAANAGADTYLSRSYYLLHKDRIKPIAIYLKNDKEFSISMVYRKGKLEIPRIDNFIKEWKKFLDKQNYSSRLELSKK